MMQSCIVLGWNANSVVYLGAPQIRRLQGHAIRGAIEELDRLICRATRLPYKQQRQTLRGGGESAGSIGKKNAEPHHLTCLLAHDLINKLSVIIGRCDLIQQENPKDSSLSTQLGLIRGVANAMAVDLKQEQRRLNDIVPIAMPR